MPWLIKADSVFVTFEFEAAIYKTREFKGRIVIIIIIIKEQEAGVRSSI